MANEPNYRKRASDFGTAPLYKKLIRQTGQFFQGRWANFTSWNDAIDRNDFSKLEELYLHGLAPPLVSNSQYFYKDGLFKTLNRDPRIFELLLKLGADPDEIEQNNYHDAPIHRACRLGRWQHAQLLLKYGANPNIIDGNKFTPVLSCLDGFGALRARKPAQMWAMVAELIRHGADPNVFRQHETSLTSYATNPARLRWLNHKGCNTEPNFLLRNWLVHGLAIDEKSTEYMVSYLLSNGGDIDTVDKQGRTPFQNWILAKLKSGYSSYLWEKGGAHRDEFEDFIRKGADPTHQDFDRNTIFHLILNDAHTAKETRGENHSLSQGLILKLLIEKMPDNILMQNNNHGVTPFDLMQGLELGSEIQAYAEKKMLENALPESNPILSNQKLKRGARL